jgi:peptide-methionine (S)-S-oxide reductase
MSHIQYASNDLSRRRRARVGDIVTVDLELTPDNGFVPERLFDTHGPSVSFVLGWGNYLPGLHDLVTGMQVGDQVNGVSIDAGWGDRNPDLVIEVPRENLKKLLTNGSIQGVGSVLNLKGGITVTVTGMTEDCIIVDANHPLAGSSYSCSLTVLEIESLPEGCDKKYESSLQEDEQESLSSSTPQPSSLLSRYEVATWALGCFWGGELAFMRTPGVVGTKVGYTQGITVDPTYEVVCAGRTQHREAIMVVYDPTIVTYQQLSTVFLERLASTTSQYKMMSNMFEEEDDDEAANDSFQYKNGLYYHNKEQRTIAQKVIAANSKLYSIELKEAAKFYEAEEYHQQYLLKGGQSARKGAKETIRCFG